MVKLMQSQLGGYFKAHIVSYFFITLLFTIGIVVGALAVKTLPDEQKIELIGYLQTFFHGLNSGNSFSDSSHLMGSALIANLKSVVIMWLLGFTIVGIPFVLFIVFTRGFVIGFTVGFLVNEYVMKGVVFALAAVLPHNFFAVPAVIVTGVSATTFSLLLLNRRGKVNLLYESIGYSIICLCMAILMIFAALIEVYISPVFMKVVSGFFFQ